MALHFNRSIAVEVEKNRFKQYFTIKQQSFEPNSHARGIYADETGKISANIWMHTFIHQGGKIQNAFDEEIKYALIKHHSVLYCGGYNLFKYDEEKNKISIYPGGQGSEIWSMFSLNDSLLVLGRTNGFSLFNSNTNTFDSLRYSDKNIPEAKFVYRLFKDQTDTVWAVAENGLYKITPKSNRPSSMVNGQLPMANRKYSIVIRQSP